MNERQIEIQWPPKQESLSRTDKMVMLAAKMLRQEAVWAFTTGFKPVVVIKFDAPKYGEGVGVAFAQWPNQSNPVALLPNGVITSITTKFDSHNNNNNEIENLIAWCPMSEEEQAIHHVLHGDVIFERFEAIAARLHTVYAYDGTIESPTPRLKYT